MQQMQVSSTVLEWIAHNRARKIQEVFIDYMFERRRAALIIQKRWRNHKKMVSFRELRMAQQNRIRRRIAINRIYGMHRNIKVKKVNASCMLMQSALA